VEDSQYLEPPLQLDADADRYDHRARNDDYTQAGNLSRLLREDERRRLFGNIAASMQRVPRVITDWQLEHFRGADPAYAEGGSQGAQAFTRQWPQDTRAGLTTGESANARGWYESPQTPLPTCCRGVCNHRRSLSGYSDRQANTRTGNQ
jgi:hypothetical protein